MYRGLAALSLVASMLLASASKAKTALLADLIFSGGTILTNDPKQETVEAVAVRDGRIVAVGAAAAIAPLAGPSTRRIDIKGKTMMPGFYDNHVHLGGNEDSREQNWREIASKQALLDAIEKHAAQLPTGEWVIAALKNENMPQERLPTRWEIDRVAPHHPVVLNRGHMTVINSLAMRLSGITNKTAPPRGGGMDRDERGQVIGWFREGAGKRMATKGMPPPPPVSDEFAEDLFRRQLTALLPYGITSVNMAGMRPYKHRWLQNVYRKWGDRLPRTTAQVFFYPGYDSYDDPALGAEASIKELEGISLTTGFGDDRLRLGAVKMAIDGGFSAGGIHTLVPYPNTRDQYGLVRVPAETLYKVAKRAHQLGWQLGIHAEGDGAIKMAVDVLDRILTEAPRSDHRHFIHHFSVLPPEEVLKKVEKNDIIVASQPNFSYSLVPDFAAPVLDPARLETNNPQMSLIKRNIRVTYGSDGMPTGPLVGIYAAVTRKGLDGKVYGPDERVPIKDALRMYTFEPAYMNFLEKERGSIEVGKVGDFVVLADNPLTTDPEKLMNIPVEMTIVAGEILYSR